MTKPKSKVINACWIVQGDSGEGTNVNLSIMNSDSIYHNYGVINSVTVPKNQPNEKDKKIVHIKTEKGTYQLFLSKIGETSDVRTFLNDGAEFRRQYNTLRRNLDLRLSGSQPTATQLFRNQANTAIGDDDEGSEDLSQDEFDSIESISQPVIQPPTKRKEICSTPTPIKKSKVILADEDEPSQDAVVIRKQALKVAGFQHNPIELRENPSGPGVERPEIPSTLHEQQSVQKMNDHCNNLILGEFTCNPCLLQQPSGSLQVRDINPTWVDALVTRIQHNANTAVPPLVAMLNSKHQSKVPLTQQQFNLYLAEEQIILLGGNHTRMAYLQIFKETGIPQQRKVILYDKLNHSFARHVAIRHNLDNEAHLKMTFVEKLLFIHTEKQIRKISAWKKAEKITLAGMLDMNAATIDTWFLLTQFVDDVWAKLERVLKGDYKIRVKRTDFHGEVTWETHPADAPTGITHLKKLIGLLDSDKLKILNAVLQEGKTLPWLADECDTVRLIYRVHNAFEHCLGKAWDNIKKEFPNETTEAEINSWIPAFKQSKKSKVGRQSKEIDELEIPSLFIDHCTKMKARSDNHEPVKGIEILEPNHTMVDTNDSQYAVLCASVETMLRKVAKTDWHIVTVDMPSVWEQDVTFHAKIEELISTVVGMNSYKTPVWFWMCELQSVGTIQLAMKKFGFGRIWSGVATNISGHPTNQIPSHSVKGIVCGTQNYSEKCIPLCLDLNPNNLFESPKEFGNPKSTDTHDHFCRTPKAAELMRQLLQMVIQPEMKVLELFARTGPVMQTTLAAHNCSCLSVDSSSIACRYISQIIHRDLEIKKKLMEQKTAPHNGNNADSPMSSQDVDDGVLTSPTTDDQVNNDLD